MSRHLIRLETHLPPPLLSALHHLADEANASGRRLYVCGSTMRDVFAGVQARELELVVDGGPAKLTVQDTLPVHVSTSALEVPPKTGGRPKHVPVSIHDYLLARDFSVNAIALSITRGSRGLLLDPTNGVADIEARELRALSSQTFQTRPLKMLELLRLKVRLGFRIYPRTQAQFEDALASGAYRRIRPAELKAEMERVAADPKSIEVLQAWDQAGLLAELLPAIAGDKLNVQGFAKLHKIRQLVPFGIDFAVDEPALFFRILTDSLNTRERATFLNDAGMDADAEWMKLGRRVSRAEKELASPSVHKPSQIYDVLTRAGPTVTLLLALESTQRVVQDRVRNYLTKYLPTAAEAVPGEPLAKLLDARPKKAAAGAGSEPAGSVPRGSEAE
jgi:tRNA nucleotidyltransferase/poly(A) polymerase